MNLKKAVEQITGFINLNAGIQRVSPDEDDLDAIKIGREATQRIIDLRQMKETVQLYDDLPGEDSAVLNKPGNKGVRSYGNLDLGVPGKTK